MIIVNKVGQPAFPVLALPLEHYFQTGDCINGSFILVYRDVIYLSRMLILRRTVFEPRMEYFSKGTQGYSAPLVFS